MSSPKGDTMNIPIIEVHSVTELPKQYVLYNYDITIDSLLARVAKTGREVEAIYRYSSLLTDYKFYAVLLKDKA